MSTTNSNDVTETVIVTETNTKFMDEGANDITLASTVSNTFTADKAAAAVDVVDPLWSVKQMFSKPVVLNTITWTTSQVAGASILNPPNGEALPENIFRRNPNSVMTSVAKNWTYFRATMVFKIMVNATKFHYGRLMVGFQPLRTTTVGDQYQASGLPHVLIDAANSQPVIFKVPFFSPVSMLNMTDTTALAHLGQLFCIVLNNLHASTGVSASVNVTVMAHFEDVELSVPIASTASAVPVGTPKGVFYEHNETQSGLKDDIGSITKGVKQLASGDFAAALQTGVGFAAKHPELLKMMFDRPIKRDVDVMSKSMTLATLAHGSGPDTVSRLSLIPESLHIPNAAVLSGFDTEFDLRKLAQKYMLFTTINWTDAQVTGTNIFSTSVRPYDMVQPVSASVLRYNYAAFIQQMFCYFRGGVKIRLDIVASQFHTGRIACVYTPGFNSNITYPDCLISPTTIIDLANSENRSFEIRLPYLYNRPWLNVGPWVPSYSTTQQFVDNLGQFNIFVQNELAHPDNVGSEVDINLYFAFDEDVEFVYPKPSWFPTANFGPNIDMPNVVFPGLYYEQKTNETQAGLHSIIDGDSEDVDLCTAVQHISRDTSHFCGEVTMHLRDIIRRYGPLFPDTQVLSTTTPGRHGVLMIPVMPSGSYNLPGCPMSFFARMFIGWSGSIRYKILFNNGQINPVRVTAIHLPDFHVSGPTNPASIAFNDYYDRGGYALKVNNLTNEHGIEVEVPYASQYHFLQNYYGELGYPSSNADLSLAHNGMLVLDFDNHVPSQYTEPFECVIYGAAGDDFMFHFAIPPFGVLQSATGLPLPIITGS
jgi:hypothetical protein